MNKLTTREKYLLRVRNAMLPRFRHKDIYATLEDLNLLFEAGAEDGKSEEELCKELGTPKDFVEAMLDEESLDKFPNAPRVYGMAGILILAITLPLLLRKGRILSPVLLCAPVIVIPFFLWYVLGGQCLYHIRQKNKNRGIDAFFCVLCYILSLGIAITQQICILSANQAITNNNAENVIPFVAFMDRLSSWAIAAAIAVFLLESYRFYRGNVLAPGILALSLGVICSSLSWRSYLTLLDAFPVFYACILPCAAAVLFSLLYYLYLWKRGGGIRLLWTHR